MGGRILVIDDDPLLRSTLAGVLEEEGYVVDHAADGVEGLQCIATSRPDVVLVDVLMPRMNGRRFIETLKEDPKTAEIPVLVMTSMHGMEHNSRALASAEIVEKPFDAEQLLNKVALALYRSQGRMDGLSAPLTGAARGTGPMSVPASEESAGVVLLVDDDRDILLAFDRLIAEEGFTTVTMPRVTEDLPRLARVLEPRAILLDLRLPGIDGMDALRRLRAEPKLDSVPILVFSGNPAELADRAAEIRRLGAVSLPKTDAVHRIVEFLVAPPESAFRRAS